jgi:hypothetical protein
MWRRHGDVMFRERVASACFRALELLVPQDNPSSWLIERLYVKRWLWPSRPPAGTRTP